VSQPALQAGQAVNEQASDAACAALVDGRHYRRKRAARLLAGSSLLFRGLGPGHSGREAGGGRPAEAGPLSCLEATVDGYNCDDEQDNDKNDERDH
jgi:hypothetical protein